MIENLIKDLKHKKELRDLNEEYIRNLILFLKIKIPVDYEKFKRTKEFKIIFKELRRKLRKTYGIYKKLNFKEQISSKERLKEYKEMYKKIFEITGNPKSILDLGSGLNPLSYKYMNIKPIYYAGEISLGYIKKIDDYFKKNNIPGKSFKFDLINDDYSTLPKTDICFLFKVLEALEEVKKNISIEIIKNIPSDYIIVSFAKSVISGRGIIKKKGRKWFKVLLKKNNYYFETFDTNNEIFYVIRKL